MENGIEQRFTHGTIPAFYRDWLNLTINLFLFRDLDLTGRFLFYSRNVMHVIHIALG